MALSSNFLQYVLAAVSLYLAKKLGFVLFCVEGCCSRDCRQTSDTKLRVPGLHVSDVHLCDLGPK